MISFFSVVFWFPFLLQSYSSFCFTYTSSLSMVKIFLDFLGRHKKLIFISLLIVIALSIKGIYDLQVSDSPLVLKSFPVDLSNEDRIIREIMGISEAQQYLFIVGKTSEEVLQRLEKFQDYLRSENTRLGAELGPMVTSFLPSEKRQQDNVRAMKRLLAHEKEISSALEAIGLPERSIQKFFRDIAGGPGTLLTPEAWLSHDVSVGLRSFWLGHIPEGTAIVVRLHHVTDVQKIKAGDRIF